MTTQETLDAIGRAQNSLLEEGECVHHHACPCLQAELDRLKTIEEAARAFVHRDDLTRALEDKDLDEEADWIEAARTRRLLGEALYVTPNSDLEPS